MSDIGQGLAAIGDGLLQLQELWRQRSKEKIDLVLQQAGGDWGQAAQIIQSNPKLQKAFRTIYGSDIDPTQITKSVEQRIKELKEDEMERDKGAYEWSVGAGMNPLASARMADPNTANVWGPLAYEDPRMTGDENRQAALIKRGIAPKIQQYVSMIQNFQQSTGKIAPPEWYSEAGIPYPGQMQQAPPAQNPALASAASLMQMNPMTAALGQATGGSLDALTQGVQSVFGGGQPQELMPGTQAFRNLSQAKDVESKIERREDQTQAEKDRIETQRGFLKVAQDRLAEYRTHRGKTYATAIGSGKMTQEDRASLGYVQKKYDREIKMAELAASRIQTELDKLLAEERRYRLMNKMNEWEARKAELEGKRNDLETAVDDLKRQEDEEVSVYLPNMKRAAPAAERKSVFDKSKW